jgi:hypothetical protein
MSDRLIEELEKALYRLDTEFVVMDGQTITFRFDVIQGVRNKVTRVRNALVKRYDWPTEPTPGRGDSDA